MYKNIPYAILWWFLLSYLFFNWCHRQANTFLPCVIFSLTSVCSSVSSWIMCTYMCMSIMVCTCLCVLWNSCDNIILLSDSACLPLQVFALLPTCWDWIAKAKGSVPYWVAMPGSKLGYSLHTFHAPVLRTGN